VGTMRGFAKRMKVISDGVGKNADAMVRKVVITVASSVALATPVDTGRARSNWRTQIGSPNENNRDDFAVKNKKGKVSKRMSATGAAGISINEAVEKSKEYKNKSGTPVYITNNLPYIGRLNEGSSKQAPEGFVQKAIIAGQRAINKSRLIK